MQSIVPYITRFLAAFIGLVWCYIEPSLNYIGVCFFALALDCYTAWRLNRRIYSRYREAIKQDPRCKIDGKLKSKKMTKMVQDFSVLIMAIFLATAIDTVILDYMNPLHLANYLAALYCGVQFVSILENESTCNGAGWARAMQKIVADKTERHFNIKLKELMKEESEIEESASNGNANDADKSQDDADKWEPAKDHNSDEWPEDEEEKPIYGM